MRMQSELGSVRFAVVRDTSIVNKTSEGEGVGEGEGQGKGGGEEGEEEGEIIAQAEWHFYDKDAKGDVMVLDFLEGTEEEREYGGYLIGTFQGKRREAIARTEVHLMCKICFIQSFF